MIMCRRPIKVSSRGRMINRKFLLCIPAITYLVSYVYLALYHGTWNLWGRVVHEGGLTFGQDMFYASHFLGHIPVHAVLALLLVGSYRLLSHAELKGKICALTAALIVFLAVTWIISVQVFSLDDTLAYIFQRKQGVFRFEQGGSWNLHLPSTMMQFLLIPLYVGIIRIMFGRPLAWNRKGLPY